MAVKTFTHTVTTTSSGNYALSPSTVRLSWLVQNPTSGSTVYLVTNSTQTTSDGLILNAGDTLKSNWFDDGWENVNRGLAFIIGSGTSDIKITETIADSQEIFNRITKGVRN